MTDWRRPVMHICTGCGEEIEPFDEATEISGEVFHYECAPLPEDDE